MGRHGHARGGRRLTELLFGGVEPAGGSRLERQVRAHVDRLEALIQSLDDDTDEGTAESAVAAAASEVEDASARDTATLVQDLAPTAQPQGPVGYVLFYLSEGSYAVREAEGPAPEPGDRVDGLVVLRIGPSPLPGDRRPCAFLEPELHLVAVGQPGR